MRHQRTRESGFRGPRTVATSSNLSLVAGRIVNAVEVMVVPRCWAVPLTLGRTRRADHPPAGSNLRASRLAPDLRARCEVVEGDQGDLTTVAGATAGADALYWVNPPTDDDDPVAGHARMGEVAAAAVGGNAVPRVVFQSSVGAEVRHGFGEIDGPARTGARVSDRAGRGRRSPGRLPTRSCRRRSGR